MRYLHCTAIMAALLSYHHMASALSYALPDLGEFSGMEDVVCRVYKDDVFLHDDVIGIVKKDGKYGLADKQGKLLIPLIYEYGRCVDSDVPSADYTYLNSYFAFKKDGKWGVVDVYNHIIVPFKYADDTSFSYNGSDKFVLFQIIDNDKEHTRRYAMIDKGDKLRLEWRAEPMRFLTPHYLAISDASGDKYGIIDVDDNQIIAPQYDDIYYLGRDRYVVVTNHQVMMIDINNHQLGAGYHHIYDFNDQGYAAVVNRIDVDMEHPNHVGFIDTQGNLIVAMRRYDYPPLAEFINMRYQLDTTDGRCRVYLADEYNNPINDPDYPDVPCKLNSKAQAPHKKR